MGSSPSKPSPHMQSPRHTSISGRVRIDSPRMGSTRSLRSVGSLNRLTERSPLVVKPLPAGEAARLLVGEDEIPASPPLAVWIGPALACALAYALYNIFIKKGSASINPILGGVILQFVAAILGCVLLSCVMYYQSIKPDDEVDPEEAVLMWDWTGVKWAILAGVAVGAAEMISFCVSGMGVQAMQSIPIIIGGSVMFGTVLGYLALGETLTMRGWSGVLMISIGISLVGMDDEGTGI